MPIEEFELPLKGKSEGFSADAQPANTSGYINNIRPVCFETKVRIAQRPGFDKAYSQQLGAALVPIVFITSVTVID